MPAIQALSQIVAALAAAIGATGYIILLGAAVLWIRLRQGFFPKEVPISFASREELLVMGAQALAVWVVLAIALIALSSRLLGDDTLQVRHLLADLALGFGVTVVTLTAVEGASTWVTVALSVILAVAALGWVTYWALVIRPPIVSWVAVLVPVAVGVALPFIVRPLDATKTAPTVLTAWATFAAVLVWFPAMRAQRQQIAANTSAISGLELEYPGLRPDGEGDTPPTVARLAARLRAELRQARTRLYVRAVAIGLAGLLVLGVISVSSQFEKKNMFQEALVTLDNGRCVEGTYLSRNKEQVVLGDQQRLELVGHGNRQTLEDDKRAKNRILVIPSSQVAQLQVRNPVGVGLPLTNKRCTDVQRSSPAGSESGGLTQPLVPVTPKPGAHSPAEPEGPVGPQGPPGRRGPVGKRGPTGRRGPSDSDRTRGG